MKITGNNQHLLPKLDRPTDGQDLKASWHDGQLAVNRPVADLLEISHEARQLADEAVKHHEVYRYDSLPAKPHGAPDDYIPIEELMKRFEPETFHQLQEALKQNAAEGLSILLKFAKQIPQNPEWLSTYRSEMEQNKNR